jgi:hypothetical protein
MSDLDKKVAQAMGIKSVNTCEQWGKSMAEEDEEFQRLEREAKMRALEDDDTQDYVRSWVGLTDDEINACDPSEECWGLHKIARAIEAKLKEKNT